MKRTSMDSIARRTRSRWDDYYREKYAELKRKAYQESSGVGGSSGSGKRLRNATLSYNTCGERSDIGSIRRRSVRGVKNNDTTGGKGMRQTVDGLESEDILFLDEQVVSDGSNSINGSGSRTGSRLKVDNFDEVASSFTKNVVSAKVGTDDVVKRGRGRPRIKPLDASVGLDKSIESGNSEESVYSDVSESESMREEDEEFSDEDYKAESSPDSESSGGCDVELEKDGVEEESGVLMIDAEEFSSVMKSRTKSGKKEADFELEIESEEGEEEQLPDAFEDRRSTPKNTRIDTREEHDMEQEQDDERDDEDYRGNSHRNRNSDHQNADGGVIVIGAEEFSGTRKIAKKNQKGSDGNSKKNRDVSRVEVMVDSDLSNDKQEMNLAKLLRSDKISTVNEHKSSRDDDDSYFIYRVVRKGKQCSEKKLMLGKRKPHASTKLDFIKILVDTINKNEGQQSVIKKNASTRDTLPSRFRFEDEVMPPLKKSEWEKHIDSLFFDLELGVRESEMDLNNCNNLSEENEKIDVTETNETPAARCGRGEHLSILDEQIGIVCRYCHAIILDIKYVLPDFYTPTSVRQDRKDSDDLPGSFTGQIQFPGPDCIKSDPSSCVGGTIWGLIPGVDKGMYAHQREGVEFIWKNIAGDTIVERLNETLQEGRGCIISHAPGTGKTRLTITFLRTFLFLYPSCCPMIIAPRGMLLNWENEFVTWKFDVSYHNLNSKELSGNENVFALEMFGQVCAGMLSVEGIRLLKLYSWTKDGGILGISYTLFEKLAGENGKEGGLHGKIREVLLNKPGLLVLDEGHTPRNERSLIWKALSRVATQRRIILSGTPFQNNLIELYNTLCLVNPRFANQIGSGSDATSRKKWANLTNSIGKSRDDGLKKLRAMLDPFVHVHKGNVLQEKLPGLRHTLVFLHPTECQKPLLESCSKVKNVFSRIRRVSLVSVHPSLNPVMKKKKSVDQKSKLDEIESDVDAGVKMKFLMKLIWLADALGERVLIFSQFIDPLLFIKKQISSHLSWKEGRELLYMDGQLDEKQRQDSIASFNDNKSKAKVLLASERACSEGINLVGASRVVLLDTVWNPSVEKQAISRAYRLGQKKVVNVYRLFTSGIEVQQFAQQIKKVKLSEMIFSPGDGQTCRSEKPLEVSEDKILESMLNLERFNQIFERIICQPKETDIVEIFGLKEQGSDRSSRPRH